MPDKNDNASGKVRRMQKRVETKDDGRLLIYYTFDEAAGADSESERADKQAKPQAVRK